LLTGGEARQGSFFADIFTEARDVFDRHENSMTLGVVELKILGNRPISRLDLSSSHVSAEAMGGMEH
jgi:hypothetical protein